MPLLVTTGKPLHGPKGGRGPRLRNLGLEPICYRGPLCPLPLSKRAAQLFSHTMKPVKNEKTVQQLRRLEAGQRKFKTVGLAWMLRGPHEILLRATCSSPLV